MWIGKPLKVLLHAESFYEGIFVAEQKNGILIEATGRKVYISYDSIISLEEI